MKLEQNWVRAIGKLAAAASEVLQVFEGKPCSPRERESLKRLRVASERLVRIGRQDAARVMSQDEVTQRMEDLVLAVIRDDEAAYEMLLDSLLPVDHRELNIALAGMMAGFLCAEGTRMGEDPAHLVNVLLHGDD